MYVSSHTSIWLLLCITAVVSRVPRFSYVSNQTACGSQLIGMLVTSFSACVLHVSYDDSCCKHLPATGSVVVLLGGLLLEGLTFPEGRAPPLFGRRCCCGSSGWCHHGRDAGNSPTWLTLLTALQRARDTTCGSETVSPQQRQHLARRLWWHSRNFARPRTNVVAAEFLILMMFGLFVDVKKRCGKVAGTIQQWSRQVSTISCVLVRTLWFWTFHSFALL